MPQGDKVRRIYTADELIAKRRSLWEKHKASGDMRAAAQHDAEYREEVCEWMQRNEEGCKTLLKEMQDEPSKLIQLFYVLVNKDMDTVPFFLNEVQTELRDILTQAQLDFKAGKRNHLKFLLLKSRQQGFTQFITAYQLACSILRRNFSGFTLADTSENAEAIFTDKAKFMFDNLPEFIKPAQLYNSRRELFFDKENGKGLNSKVRVATAGNEEVGRSKTVNFFHGSEVAFWKNIKSILSGLGGALTPKCMEILETTAKGYNAYKALWDDTHNNYTKLFFPWWKTSEYSAKFESEEVKARFLRRVKASKKAEDANTEAWAFFRVKWLLKGGRVTPEQAYWYYNKWRDIREDIKQEYPCTPKEAFLSTGNNYFSVEILTARYEQLLKLANDGDDYIARGQFEYQYVTDPDTQEKTIDTDTIEWVDAPHGYIKIFIEAEPYVGYVIGADTATDGSDKNIGQAIDTSGEQVATLVIDSDEDLFADQLFCLGWYYNYAFIVPEVNHSTHPTKVLLSRGYPNLYMRGSNEDPTSEGQKTQDKYGFRTGEQNRKSMLGLLRTLARENPERIHDIDTIMEMLSFVRNQKGKPVAEEGEHDDRVLAYALALIGIDLQEAMLNTPLGELEGYYTESELEDMGYSRHQIKGYLEGKLKLYRED